MATVYLHVIKERLLEMIYPEHIQSLHHTQNMPTKYIIVIILMVKINNLKSFFLLSVLTKLWHMIERT
jgi:hypothetical protein